MLAAAFDGSHFHLPARFVHREYAAIDHQRVVTRLPLGVALSRAAAFRSLSPGRWASVAYLVALTSVAAYLLYDWALSRAEASRVAVWSNTQPVLTALLAWVVYSDPLTPSFVAGGALVILGVWMTQRG